MPRSAVLVAALMIGTSCAAADDEFTRMQELPLVVAVDAVGEEIVVYDPSEATSATTTAPDLFADTTTTSEAAAVTSLDDSGSADTTDSGSNDEDPPPTTDRAPADGDVPVVKPVVVERYPHDGSAFTQGLAYVDGVLIEGLGLIGESARRRVAPTTGEVITSARLDADLFGAGLDVTDEGQVIQLTWQQGVAIVSDPTTMLELSRFTYDGEGWGICQLASGGLVTSNGSGLLTVRDLETFAPVSEIEVTLEGEPVTNLNELECVGDSIFANVWLESVIYEIDTASGEVRRVIDAADLVPGDGAPDDVLNGIAHRPESDTFFLTGKRWTVMYEVSLG